MGIRITYTIKIVEYDLYDHSYLSAVLRITRSHLDTISCNLIANEFIKSLASANFKAFSFMASMP